MRAPQRASCRAENDLVRCLLKRAHGDQAEPSGGNAYSGVWHAPPSLEKHVGAISGLYRELCRNNGHSRSSCIVDRRLSLSDNVAAAAPRRAGWGSVKLTLGTVVGWLAGAGVACFAHLAMCAPQDPVGSNGAPLVIEPAPLGNVMDAGKRIALPVHLRGSVSGDVLDWTAVDLAGKKVAGGEQVFSAGAASIQPGISQPGYFEIDGVARRGSTDLANTKTSLVLLAPATGGGPLSQSHFGVMTHFAQGWDTDIMPLVARLGIAHIRDEQYWGEIEKSRGIFVFPDRFTRYMAEAARLSIDPLLDLTFANKLYDGGMTPYSQQGIDAYARYAQNVLARYGRQVHAVEIWNEYNGSFVKGPVEVDRPAAYVRMLREAYSAIKAVRPDVNVVGGAVVLIPLPYLEKVFAHGGLDYMDVLSIHPYREYPEGVEYDLADLKALMARFAHGKSTRIWATEIGKQDNAPGGRKRVARYLVRLSTILLSEGVQRIYWYLLRDYNQFATMGLFRDANSSMGRYAPAPAAAAYANLIRRLDAATFKRREDTDPRTRIYLFERGGIQCRVAWATDEPWPSDQRSISITLATTRPLKIIDIDGGDRMESPLNGRVSLHLNHSPVFVEGPVSAIEEDRSDIVVTQSEADFSSTQGASGWYYGYSESGGGDGATRKFVELSWLRNGDWGWHWADPSLPYLAIDRDGAHPGLIGGRVVSAVRRWRSTIAGNIGISGDIKRLSDSGKGTEARVRVDGRLLYTVDVGGPAKAKRAKFVVGATVGKGSVVDFELSPTPGSADLSYDATDFHVTITRAKP